MNETNEKKPETLDDETKRLATNFALIGCYTMLGLLVLSVLFTMWCIARFLIP